MYLETVNADHVMSFGAETILDSQLIKDVPVALAATKTGSSIGMVAKQTHAALLNEIWAEANGAVRLLVHHAPPESTVGARNLREIQKIPSSARKGFWWPIYADNVQVNAAGGCRGWHLVSHTSDMNLTVYNRRFFYLQSTRV